jgi:glycosyltransferase involved in cell wall biosynthesis
MKILYYNWIQDFDPEKRGGGVRIYQENLIHELVSRKEHEIFTLYSGITYSFFKKRPYIRKVRLKSKAGIVRGVSSFEIVNSDIMSPGHSCFGENDRLFERNDTYRVFDDFIGKHGPFDVVHFNNLEGLPFSVLELEKKYSATKFILSIHNYYAVCPQVNLWRNEAEHCYNYENGRLCEGCVRRPDVKELLFAHRLANTLKQLGLEGGSTNFAAAFELAVRMRQGISHVWPARAISLAYQLVMLMNSRRSSYQLGPGKAAHMKPSVSSSGSYAVPGTFKYRREAAIELINKHCDKCLAVSGQVRDVVVSFGFRADITAVSYIGTRHYESFMTNARRIARQNQDELSICYMGYMRRDKGFYFLLETLEKLPDSLSCRIQVKIIAPAGDKQAVERLRKIAPKYAFLEVIDGYTHDELDSLLADCDIGIIPVLWEDNLPQVAIEIVSRGIPILTSHLGGAKELGGLNSDFMFFAGNHESLIRKISKLLSGEIQPASFWKQADSLISMEQHVTELLLHYKGSAISDQTTEEALSLLTVA